MARTFSNVKLFSNRLSLLVRRKGYGVAGTEGRGRGRGGGGGLSNLMMNNKLIKGGDHVVQSAWLPDPVTGYYRPENQADQIDAVELRRMLLKSKFTRH